MKYTPLHIHTSRGSLLDSTNTPQSLVKRIKELGLSSIAITDHGSCSNHLEFYKECKENNIKPILGMEAYTTPDMNKKEKDSPSYHLVLLAKNQEGYDNLLKITSVGHLEGFYYKPKVDLSFIKQNGLGSGIIALSACLGGMIPQYILKDKESHEIRKVIKEHKDTFEEYYLEIQPSVYSNNEEQEKVNRYIQDLCNDLNIEPVATSDAHFTNKEDFELHNVFIQISQSRDNEVYKECWLKSPQEMLEGFSGLAQEFIERALENTNKIAERCNVELTIGKSQVPTAEIPKGKTLEQYFYDLVVNGCKEKGFQNFPAEKKETYWNRIKHEYHVMTEKGFVDYFLLLKEIIDTARKKGIVISPSARGSGASSLICYVLGITNVDPIKHNLIFERFLTIEKKGLPD